MRQAYLDDLIEAVTVLLGDCWESPTERRRLAAMMTDDTSALVKHLKAEVLRMPSRNWRLTPKENMGELVDFHAKEAKHARWGLGTLGSSAIAGLATAIKLLGMDLADFLRELET